VSGVVTKRGAEANAGFADALPPGFSAHAPEISIEHIPCCPVCGSAIRAHFASGYDYELQTCRNGWNFWQCGECRAVWLDPRPAAAELSVIYPRSYYAYNRSEKVTPIVGKAKAALDRIKFNSFLRRTGIPGSFLDIGCGDGRYLDLFERRGVPKDRIYGLDLSDEQVQRLCRRGYRAYRRQVEDCSEIPAGSIDLAIMFHVIEHVADPVPAAPWSSRRPTSTPGMRDCSRSNGGAATISRAIGRCSTPALCGVCSSKAALPSGTAPIKPGMDRG